MCANKYLQHPSSLKRPRPSGAVRRPTYDNIVYFWSEFGVDFQIRVKIILKNDTIFSFNYSKQGYLFKSYILFKSCIKEGFNIQFKSSKRRI